MVNPYKLWILAAPDLFTHRITSEVMQYRFSFPQVNGT